MSDQDKKAGPAAGNGNGGNGGNGDESSGQPPWDLDTAFRIIGPCGRWQLGIYCLMATLYLTMAFHFVAFVFMVDTPEHHCKIPANMTKNETIPKIFKNDEWVDDRCHMYVNLSHGNETMPCTDGWEFDPNSGYISTIVTDFELTCSKNILVEVSMMISSGSMAIFQVIANKMADIVGRKPLFMAAVTLRSLFGVLKGLSPNMLAYIILDACMQISVTGYASILLLMCHELFPPEKRSLAATTLEFFWFSSLMLTTLLVYLIRNWRVLQIVMHAPIFFGIVAYWVFPESIPWLIVKKKFAVAQKILERGARINRRQFPPGFFTGEYQAALNDKTSENGDVDTQIADVDRKRNSTIGSTLSLASAISTSGPVWVKMVESAVDVQKAVDEEEEEQSEGGWRHSTSPTVSDVFKSRKLLLYTIIIFLGWFTNSIVYSALNLTVTYLSGDRYLNFLLLNLAEFPAILSFHLSMNKFGRRGPLCTFHIIAGVALLLTLLDFFGVESSLLQIILNFVGKFGITASYCVILVYSPEIYPTSVRSVFLGMCMFWALSANLLAPYCRPLERAIPGIVRGTCGALSLLVGILALLLPETFRRPLPVTIAHTEKWTRTVSKEERRQYKELKKMSSDMGKTAKGGTNGDVQTNGISAKL